MAPLAVDPAALSAAGAAVIAIGDDVAAALGALTAGFSANTGQDAAGEVFGLAYQDAAEALLKAAAAAINALRFNGAKIQLCASNYSKAEAASTLGGGGGGVLPAPGEPVKIAAPGPPGTLGPGVAAPLLWAVVEALIDGVWPNGHVAALRAAAGRWRAFGAALTGGQDALNKPKSAVAGQQIPEGASIQPVLSTIGTHLGELGAQCGKLATKLDAFADEVAHTQNAIRDLLHRLGTVSGLWHEVVSFFDGDALEEIKKIAADINALLHDMKREAEAQAQVMKDGMQIIDGWVRGMEKYTRGEFTHFLGQAVGNQVATVFDTYVNIDEGVFKGAVGLVQTVDQLDPTRFLYDPKGAASTWAGLGETVVKANPLYAVFDPAGALKNDLGLLKGLVHAEDWRSDRPGLGFGENLFDVATLFVPGAGEAGAGAEGAAAGTRAAAEAGVDAADAAGTVGRAGRVAGEVGEAAGAGGALADIGKAGGGLTKDLENLGGELPKTDSPLGGRPVGLPDPKPLEAPVEPTPRPMDSAVSSKTPFDPPAAPPATAVSEGPFGPPIAPPGLEPPGTPVGPHDPLPGPGGGPGPGLAGRHDPVSVPAGGPRDSVRLFAAATPTASAPDLTASGSRLSELSAPHGGGGHGPGDGRPTGSHPHERPPRGGGQHRPGDDSPQSGRPHGQPPSRDGTPHGHSDAGSDRDGLSDSGYGPTAIDPLTWDDRLALADYTGSGYEDLNRALRSDALDASHHARIDALNNALEKLPAYQGPVIRGTNLPPEVLDQYRPGEIITEDAFLSTTTNTAVARSPTFAGNVEFRILSSTGRDISSLSMFPGEQEILFPPGTRFYIVSKVLDPLTGRTVIRMVER
ncbi:ADP-ribosyltransferase [Mycobacterium sp.]|uniref:ADP-ribosyltransferase n=1 Tax=Mycobacterium sp. TaxID=1785 RepID=UPI003F97254A